MKFSTKSLTLTTLVTTSVISSMAFFVNANHALALPRIYEGKPIINNNTTLINGNIIPVSGLSNPISQTPCSEIKVVLGGTNNNKYYNLASTRASGSTISNGCTYSLKVVNYQVSIDSPNLNIEAVGRVDLGNYVYGQQTFIQPIPGQVNIQVGYRSVLK